MLTRGGALAGIRVLDLGRVLAAPWAAQVLGDLGADVIKVERPETGDDGRLFGSHVQTPSGEACPSAMFLASNRNKRAITVDFSQPAGQEIVRALARQSDVLIENFLPGTLAKLGLDAATLRRDNPRLIYCSVTGYGQDGPKSGWPGYDGVFQAHCGLMSVTGLPDDVPGGGPMKAGVSLVDVSTGAIAALAIMTALFARSRSGEGQIIEATLLDAGIALQSAVVQEYLISRQQPERRGNEGNGGHPARLFACADGDIFIVAGAQRHYEALCKALGMEDLLTDPRFATAHLRFVNRESWNSAAEPIVAMWRKRPLLEKLAEAGVPAGLANEYEAVFDDDQVRHRGIEAPPPPSSNIPEGVNLIASPLRLAGTPVSYDLPPPGLSEHTDEVLSELLGFRPEDLDALRAQGVI